MDFIPSSSYYPIYINFCLFLVVFTLFHTRILKMDDSKNLIFIHFSGLLLLVFLIIFIGQRPIYAVFGDTVNYNYAYKKYMSGGKIPSEGDYGWHIFMKFMASIASIHTFFSICAFLYIYPLYKVSKHFFGKYWYYCFILFVISFSFWTYGVNGVRNGVSLSLFLWGLCYPKNKVVMISCFAVAILFHKTALLPILAYSLTHFYNNPKTFFYIWLACIPLSLAMGSLWINLFASIGFGDDRLAGYLNSQDSELFAYSGFRWDFLFHSAFAVFSGWYFVIKKSFDDPNYNKLLNTYLICNSFWVLVINANYSNRFAYLSWFMMAIVVIYPILKKDFFKHHHFMIGKIILVYFAFTYFMYYVYYS